MGAAGAPRPLPTARHFHNHLELQSGRKNLQLHSSGNFVVMLRWIIFIWLSAWLHLGNTNTQDGCVFPARWSGKWFQSGVIQPILIEGDRLSNKGKCRSSEGDKFLIVDEKGCYRCVVMHEKHLNVLQYKETFCHKKEELSKLCSLITGDALLYSMFRESATPVACPLKGPFSFTYNRGHGDCKSPVSSMESCTEESRLLLNYQACPDVYGSESTVEELECLATWKEGSLRFLVGKVHHNHATSNEDRYRCFVYEKTNGMGSSSIPKEEREDGVEYRVAQSGDATCNGLFSATEGSRTMALKRVPLQWKCRFPTWMTFSGHWHTLDYSSMYSFHQKNATLRITDQAGTDIKVHCVSVKASSPTGNSVALIVHWQHHCAGRFVCLVLYRRDAHVAELQRGTPTPRADDACLPDNFNSNQQPYVTLVTSNPAPKACPYPGKYTITGIKHQQRSARSLQHHQHGQPNVEHILDISAPHRDNRERKKLRMERRKRKYREQLKKVLAREKNKYMRRLERKRKLDRNTTIWTNSPTYVGSARNVSIANLLRSKRSEEFNENGACSNRNYHSLDIGCNTLENMEFHSTCDDQDFVTAYSCHGGWYEEGVSYLITTPLTRDSTDARRYCLAWREDALNAGGGGGSGNLHVSRSPANCQRGLRPGLDGLLAFNATQTGECQQTSAAQSLFLCKILIALLACSLQCIYR